MEDTNAMQTNNYWPLPKFYFRVKWGDWVMAFQEVSGLDSQAEPIEYRRGNDRLFSTIKMPGLVKDGNVTMKKGRCKAKNDFLDWLNKAKMNSIERTTVVISLLDEAGNPVMVWTLKNAWPTKITGVGLQSDGNEITVESLEFAYEGIEIE
jgi:phage tail-like protein